MRPHRLPASAIALALAVGLGALLVGLSVAPQVLPGDTFRVVPRTVADNDPTHDRAEALYTDHFAVISHATELAVVLIAGHPGPSHWPLRLRTPTVVVLTDRAVPRPECRGPPHC